MKLFISHSPSSRNKFCVRCMSEERNILNKIQMCPTGLGFHRERLLRSMDYTSKPSNLPPPPRPSVHQLPFSRTQQMIGPLVLSWHKRKFYTEKEPVLCVQFPEFYCSSVCWPRDVVVFIGVHKGGGAMLFGPTLTWQNFFKKEKCFSGSYYFSNGNPYIFKYA